MFLLAQSTLFTILSVTLQYEKASFFPFKALSIQILFWNFLQVYNFEVLLAENRDFNMRLLSMVLYVWTSFLGRKTSMYLDLKN